LPPPLRQNAIASLIHKVTPKLGRDWGFFVLSLSHKVSLGIGKLGNGSVPCHAPLIAVLGEFQSQVRQLRPGVARDCVTRFSAYCFQTNKMRSKIYMHLRVRAFLAPRAALSKFKATLQALTMVAAKGLALQAPTAPPLAGCTTFAR
jgi:hypothetical protein